MLPVPLTLSPFCAGAKRDKQQTKEVEAARSETFKPTGARGFFAARASP